MNTAKIVNLNTILLKTDGYPAEESRPRISGLVKTDEVTCYFRDLREHLIEHISEAEIVLGCVAWLTDRHILKALAHVSRGVNIVVQKEDFLRPDIGSRSDFKDRLCAQYAELHPATDRQWCGTVLEGMSFCADPTIEAVRCVGNYNTAKLPAFPRMHHKFLVFCRQGIEPLDWHDEWPCIKPYAVWTGSFNLTENAAASFENALYITIPAIVQAYYEEWGWIEALSEPLNWDSAWIAPEWRIGT